MMTARVIQVIQAVQEGGGEILYFSLDGRLLASASLPVEAEGSGRTGETERGERDSETDNDDAGG